MVYIYNYYYLVYKLKSSYTYWIVDEYDEESELINLVKNFKSKDENYYVIKKQFTLEQIDFMLNTKFKRYRELNLDKNT
jgi:hypothetical protein